MSQHIEKDNKNIIRAERAGFVYLVLFVLRIPLNIASRTFLEGINLVIDFALLAFGITLVVSYILFLLGIKALAKQIQDARLAKDIFIFMLVNLSFAFLFWLILEIVTWAPILLPFSVIFCVLTGIYSIRVGNDFKRLQEQFGQLGLKVALWRKISGYLMASVVLFIIGMLVSFVADYYMWRLLQQHTKETTKTGK